MGEDQLDLLVRVLARLDVYAKDVTHGGAGLCAGRDAGAKSSGPRVSKRRSHDSAPRHSGGSRNLARPRLDPGFRRRDEDSARSSGRRYQTLADAASSASSACSKTRPTARSISSSAITSKLRTASLRRRRFMASRMR